MDLKFAKDRYDYELQRKEQLTTSLTLPVTALAIIGSGVVGMARSFSFKDERLSWFFVVLVVLDVVAIAICLVYLARMYHRQTYRYLPFLQALSDWELKYAKAKSDYDEWRSEYKQWTDFVESSGGEVPAETGLPIPPVDPSVLILERVIDAADHNSENNNRRSGLLWWARIWLFVALSVAALSGICVRSAPQCSNRSARCTGPEPTSLVEFLQLGDKHRSRRPGTQYAPF